jgi:hypothetical protein
MSDVIKIIINSVNIRLSKPETEWEDRGRMMLARMRPTSGDMVTSFMYHIWGEERVGGYKADKTS